METRQITPLTTTGIQCPELVIKKSNSSEEREKDNEAILNQLIPFSFDSLSETVIAKVRNVLHKIDKALRLHKDPKDRIKELRVIGSKLEFDINRKNDDFLFVEAVAITNIASKVEGKQLVQNMNEFLTEFPEFGGLELKEREVLLHYRNMMKISMQVIPAKWNYNHLLALVARIAEGCKVRYVTGSGATDQTKYRMIVYEKISGIPRQKRPEKPLDPLMAILKSGQNKSSLNKHHQDFSSSCDSNSEQSSSDGSNSNNTANNIGSIYSFTDLPVREKSVVLSPGLYIDSKEAEMPSGTVIRQSSVTRKKEMAIGSTQELELSRSASISSNGLGDLDLPPLFEYMHDDIDFSLLEPSEPSTELQLGHQSTYNDSGSIFHNVSITEYTGNEIINGESLLPATAGIVAPNCMTSTYLPQGIAATTTTTTNTRKRKAYSNESDELSKEHATRKICPNQTERYNCLIEKLCEDIFHREGVGQADIPGQTSFSNHIFIKERLHPKLAELENIIAKETNPTQITKKMKIFASSVGVEPLSRFNDKFLIVEVALVLLLSSRAEYQYLKISFHEFLKEQPEFNNETYAEQELLHIYRNMLAAALKVIPGKWNSNHLLDVVTRIVEGKDKKYVTGSGATKQTRNRIDVYHNLTGIEKQSKPITFVNSVFQYLSDSANSSASSSDEKGTEAEENAGFWPGPTQNVLKNFKSSLGGITEREKRHFKNSQQNMDINNDYNTHNDSNDNSKNKTQNIPLFSENTSVSSETVLTAATVVADSSKESSSTQLEITKACHTVPNIPNVKISTTEMKSNDNTVSCKTTKVFKEFTDAVTGVSFKCELARGVSVTQQSSGSFDLFDNLDLFGDHIADEDPSAMDMSCNDFSVGRQITRDRSEFDMQCIAMLQEHGQSGIHLHRETSGNCNGIVRNISITRQISNETSIKDNFGQNTEILTLLRSSSIMPVNRDSSYQILSPTRDQSLIKLI